MHKMLYINALNAYSPINIATFITVHDNYTSAWCLVENELYAFTNYFTSFNV